MKVIDDRTLALGDYRGNKQYISTGNLLSDNRVAMIMVGQIQDVVRDGRALTSLGVRERTIAIRQRRRDHQCGHDVEFER